MVSTVKYVPGMKPNMRLFKSRLEYNIAMSLWRRGIEFEYERESWEYHADVYKGLCAHCGGHDIVSVRKYTPDFFLPNGIVVETKGRLDSSTRTQLLAVMESNPDKELVLVFARDNWMTKAHKNRYSDWCLKHKIDFHVGDIPDEWLV